jgi:ABC-2 type transport system ATP-binding protein
MINIQQVTRTYGTKTAVDRLDLHIPRGELFACLGHNGAGKTTTIKMMVGLLRPTAGSIKIAGFDIATETREASLRVGYVPDEPYLYDKLSGREFLQFVAEMYGLSKEITERNIEKQIADFGLAGFVDQLSESYSHGMKQRLVFASSLLHDPELLIVDEPMVGLDPRSMRLVKDLLKKRVRNGGTVFMSTHTLAVAEEIASRIGVMSQGKIQFLGTVAELREQLSSGESLEQLFLTLTDEEAANYVSS